jgi:osmoprotectant transport system substrate-binding protein
MRIAARAAVVICVVLTTAGLAAGCGQSGQSGTTAPATAGGAGCAPIAGDTLVVLDDDKKLQTADNIIAAINAKASNPTLVAALDKVAEALDTPKLIALNKAVDVDRKTAKAAADEFAASAKLTDGLAKGPGGNIIVGAGNFSESEILGNLYAIALKGAGYNATVQQIGNRELYEPALEKGQIQVIPEYAGTLTEFLNKKVNGATAKPLASGDIDKTVAALKDLGSKAGLTFGKPSAAADQNAFAVTKAVADKYSLKTLSDFGSKCSGAASVLGGPAECPQRPFCQPGLESTYGIKFGKFVSFGAEAGGPQTKNALKTGVITMGLVFSSDGALASG